MQTKAAHQKVAFQTGFTFYEKLILNKSLKCNACKEQFTYVQMKSPKSHDVSWKFWAIENSLKRRPYQICSQFVQDCKKSKNSQFSYATGIFKVRRRIATDWLKCQLN